MLFFSIICYLIALIFQFSSALISFFLFKYVNKYKFGWAFLSTVLFVMIYLRIAPLIMIFESKEIVISDAITSVITSLLILLAIFSLKKIVIELERRNMELKEIAKIDSLTGAYGRAAERLRRKIEKYNFNYLHKKININISAGISYYDPNKDRSSNPNSIFLKYLKRADEAMYTAKNKGRNRVMQWTANI